MARLSFIVRFDNHFPQKPLLKPNSTKQIFF